MHEDLPEVEGGGLLDDGRLVRGHEAGHAAAHGLAGRRPCLVRVQRHLAEDVSVAGEDEAGDEGDGAGAEVGRGALEVGEGARDERREEVAQGALRRVGRLAKIPETEDIGLYSDSFLFGPSGFYHGNEVL